MVSMDLKSFESLLLSEHRARLFFVKSCWKNYRRFCIKCHGYKIYRIIGKRFRCKRCGYTFHDFSGRWINNLRISPKQWLWIIKCFELELSARKIASQIGLSYPTVLKAVTLIRLAIVAHSRDAEELLAGEIELDEAYFGGRRKGKRGRGAFNKVPVFGILERNGSVVVTAVTDVSAETLLNHTVKMVRRGSIVYTDKFRSYDALMFCGYKHMRIDHRKRFSNGKVYINGLEGFWSYAKERLIKHHGVSKQKFPLYLKEMEFRYNNRHRNIFTSLVKYLCDLVPDLL
jgi:transposase